MKRFLVIGRRNAGENNNAVALAQAIDAQSNAEVIGAYFEDIVITAGDNQTNVYVHGNAKTSISSFDSIILINWSHDRLYIDLAHSIAFIAAKQGLKVWNSELVTARSSTKISQTVRLSYEDIPLPRTVFSLTPEHAKEYMHELGQPFIAKDPLASRGRRNYLCTSWDDFKAQAEQPAAYIFQENIPNDASDIRVFVAGGEARLIIHRAGSGESHLNNVSQGAAARLIELDDVPPELLVVTNRIATIFQRELCGIDFIQNSQTKEYIFLEINTTPQIINGVFAEEKVAAINEALMR